MGAVHKLGSGHAEELVTRVVKLLGGPKVLGVSDKRLLSKIDAHEVVSVGLPRKALLVIIEQSMTFRQEDFVGAVGMSVRSLQRLKQGNEPLSAEHSSRTWKFAEILAKATALFGTRAEAENWLKTPAIALNQRRPIDLLTSAPGAEAVEQLLDRLEYGVYT